MIEVRVPGFGELRLEHLVLDYNGTLAQDGELITGVAALLRSLATDLALHVVTADTFGRARAALEGIPCETIVLPVAAQDVAKRDHVRTLGAERVVAIGNGRNDALMLAEAALGIALLQQEGAAAVTIAAADVVCPDIASALELLRRPLRLTATLRS
jgi:soluble P-type ATPase